MKIEDVKCWHVDRGVSHAVSSVGDPGTYTLCGTLHWGEFAERGTPHNGRICRECRRRLKTAATMPPDDSKEDT